MTVSVSVFLFRYIVRPSTFISLPGFGFEKCQGSRSLLETTAANKLLLWLMLQINPSTSWFYLEDLQMSTIIYLLPF